MIVTDELKLAVWSKWKIVSWYESKKWRQDECLAWIWFDYYWDRNSLYGWEIDHISPQSNWWSDNLSNLRPLQWENNTSKSDWRLVCKVKAFWEKNSRILKIL